MLSRVGRRFLNFILDAEIWVHFGSFRGFKLGLFIRVQIRVVNYMAYISAPRMKFKNRRGAPDRIYMRGFSIKMSKSGPGVWAVGEGGAVDNY